MALAAGFYILSRRARTMTNRYRRESADLRALNTRLTREIAEQPDLGLRFEAAADLVDPAREAFVSAMHVTAIFTALAALIAAADAAALRPGMFARAEIAVGAQPAATVPTGAVLTVAVLVIALGW